MAKKTIYFLCTGNSCRSQMAEGFAKRYLGDMYEIYSAGIDPIGVHPLAIQVMKEKGIDISNQSSDVVSVSMVSKADYIITLCKDTKERCPVVLPRSSHFHWSFEDPTKVKGTEEEITEAFRCIRDQIEKTIKKFAQGDPSVEINFDVNQSSYLVPKKDFGERIKQTREGLRLSVKECSELLASTEDYLLRTEKNLTKPSKFFIHRFAKLNNSDYEDMVKFLYEESSSTLHLVK